MIELRYVIRILVMQIILCIYVFAGDTADYLTTKEFVGLRIKPDKTYSKRVLVEKKILSYNGKKELSEFKVFYDSRYEKVSIVEAYTEKPDGSIMRTGKNVIKELDSPYESGMMEFAVTKMLLIPFLGVEVGDTVHLEFIKENNSGRDIFDSYVFAGTEKAVEKTYEIEYSKGMELKVSENNVGKKLKKTKEKSGDMLRLIYSSKGVLPYKPEQSMPLPERIFPTVYVSTYKGVEKYGEAIYSKYFKSTDSEHQAIAKLGDELLEGSKNELESLSRIKRYFSEEFLYMPQDDIFKFQPRDFSEIIGSGYGTPVEAYMIFDGLMKRLGIENSIVVAGDEEHNFKRDLKNGNIVPFSYLISRISLGGKVYYVDILNEFYNIDESEFDKKIGMMLGEKVRFENINCRTKNTRNIVYLVKIDQNGNAAVHKENNYNGGMASLIRSKYKYMTEYELKKDYEKLMSAISIFARPTSDLKIELGEDTAISYEYIQDNYASTDGEFMYFDLDASLAPYVLELDPGEREFAFESTEDLTFRRRYEIRIPENYQFLLMPEPLKYRGKVFGVQRKVEVLNGRLVINDAINYRNGLVKQKGYEKFYETYLELSHPGNTRVLLRKIVEK